MQITKSIYVEFLESPKLAWWKVNSPETYNKIKNIEPDDESEEEPIAVQLWKSIEVATGHVLKNLYSYDVITNAFDDSLLSEIKKEEGLWIEDSIDDLILITKYKSRTLENIEKTIQSIINKDKIIYQPWFIYNDFFIRADFLVLNSNWTYDLVEVKAKSRVRKGKYYDSIKQWKIWELESKFFNDASFQKYVIWNAFDEISVKFNIPWLKLENIYFAYLNSDYRKNWDIDYSKLIKLDQVDVEKEIYLKGWNKKEDSTFLRDDKLDSKENIEFNIELIKKDLELSLEEFNKKHPFTWSEFEEYFWEKKDSVFWTIYWKWIAHSYSWKLKKDWTRNIWAVESIHYSKRTECHASFDQNLKIECLSTEEIDLFKSKTGDWLWTDYLFTQDYLYCHVNKEDIIREEEIKNELSKIKYPLYFYDYESINSPIPLLDKTKPYQQGVVQYSIHKVFEDWRIEHYSWIYAGQEDLYSFEKDLNSVSLIDEVDYETKSNWVNTINIEPNKTDEWFKLFKTGTKEDEIIYKIKKVIIENNKNKVEGENEKIITGDYRWFIEEFLKDMDISLYMNEEDWTNHRYIVWNKWFENTQNKEIWKMYSEFEERFLKINSQTYDLMEIFSKRLYFSHAFKGSFSIKYVLPYFEKEMSYKALEVSNWWIAMELLKDIITKDYITKIIKKIEKEKNKERGWMDESGVKESFDSISKEDIKKEIDKTLENLLLYCGQDSLAMYKIYVKLWKLNKTI